MQFIGGIILLPLIILVILVVFGISNYNNLVKRRERVQNAMAQIGAQLESRWDAINTLIDATKDYKSFETETLEKITASRNPVTRNSTVSEVENDDNKFESAVGRLIAVAENYPDLKASNLYENTMNKIAEFEDKVRHSRMIYNDTVTNYNESIKVFPGSIFASIFGFKEEDYFKTSEGKTEAPSWNR